MAELEEIEELEELEELEEAVPESFNKAQDNAPRGSAALPLKTAAPLRRPSQAALSQAAGSAVNIDAFKNNLSTSSIITARLFHTSVFPVLLISKDLKIFYANPSSKKFFVDFFNLGSNFFFDIFGKYFQIEDVKKIRDAVIKGENGYSWSGTAQIKSKERTPILTRVYIFPAGTNTKSPTEFTVLFDDITEENRRLIRSQFLSLLEASKLKDNDTGKHITRVNYYSEALAKILYNRSDYSIVDAEFIDNIGFLASMHDVGKIGTPDDILNKEGPLSDFEWNIMQEHTKNGAFILEAYPNPMAKEIALSHHEKWNGSGYPFQIEGDMIPLSARIVSLADVYDALRMRRSYKKALSHEDALEKIMESKGTQFDPKLTDIFYSISADFNDIYERNKDI